MSLNIGQEGLTFLGKVERTRAGYVLSSNTGQPRPLHASDANALLDGSLMGLGDLRSAGPPPPRKCGARVKTVRAAEAQKAINSGKKVMMKFYSPGCEACGETAPEVAIAARNLCGDAQVVGVNIDKDDPLARLATCHTGIQMSNGSSTSPSKSCGCT